MARRWTDEDDRFLLFRWGWQPVYQIAQELRRTENAINQRAQKLALGPLGRGYYDMKTLIRITGYDYKAIENMAFRLGIRLRRIAARYQRLRNAPRRQYKFSSDAADKIIQAFKEVQGLSRIEKTRTGEWGTGGLNYMKPECCVRCGTEDRPHLSRGLCGSCYTWAKKHRKLQDYSLTRLSANEKTDG